MGKTLLIGFITIVIIGAGGYFVFHKSTPTQTAATQSSSSSPADTPSSDQNAVATITYSNGGFSPSATVVKSGDKVAIKNTSSKTVQFDSDPHPSHTSNSDLNVGIVNAGQTKIFSVNEKGSFGVHNHLEPSETTKITIE